jgi:hypothetical protein
MEGAFRHEPTAAVSAEMPASSAAARTMTARAEMVA